MNARRVLIVAAMVLRAGCGGNTNPDFAGDDTSLTSPAGRWSGSFSDSVSGDGTAQLAVDGSTGVSQIVSILRTELEMAMALTGRTSLAAIDSTVLWN